MISHVSRSNPNIQISPRRLKAIKKQLDGLVLHNEEKVKAYFLRMSAFNFAGVNLQKLKLMKQSNVKRKAAGLTRLKWEDVKGWRTTPSQSNRESA